MIKYRKEKGEAKNNERKKQQSARREINTLNTGMKGRGDVRKDNMVEVTR